MHSSKKTVLIIDDDVDFLDLLRDVLETESLECATAMTAQEGLEKAQSLKPNLILLDLMLPGMSGHGLIRALKKNPELSQIPVVALSSLNDADIAMEMMNQGAVGYASKACKAKELISIVREYTL